MFFLLQEVFVEVGVGFVGDCVLVFVESLVVVDFVGKHFVLDLLGLC